MKLSSVLDISALHCMYAIDASLLEVGGDPSHLCTKTVSSEKTKKPNRFFARMPFDALQPFTIVKATELKGAASWWSYTVRQGRRIFKDLDEGTLVLNQNWDEISAKCSKT